MHYYITCMPNLSRSENHVKCREVLAGEREDGCAPAGLPAHFLIESAGHGLAVVVSRGERKNVETNTDEPCVRRQTARPRPRPVTRSRDREIQAISPWRLVHQPNQLIGHNRKPLQPSPVRAANDAPRSSCRRRRRQTSGSGARATPNGYYPY